MKNNVTIALLIIAGTVGIILLFVFGSDRGTPAPNTSAEPISQKTEGAGYESKIDSQGIVSVTVTPLQLSTDASEWKFNVVLDTHSGSLDEDMLTSAILTDSNGNEYRPTNWDGAPPGGHHREGVLTFIPGKPAPRSVTLKIQNVGVPERDFTWPVQYK